MGLFDFFKKKNREPEPSQPTAETHIALRAPSEPVSPTASEVAPVPIKPEETQFSIHSSFSRIHGDIKNLLWFGDGPYKNLTEEQMSFDKTSLSMVMAELSYDRRYDAEPSIIYTNLPVIIPIDESVIPRPPYYPKYRDLKPEQRYIYLKLLTNPYNTDINIGYVFILYYGLERHLLQGNFDAAFNVVIKLRDIYKNKSFQYYSGNAIILSALLRQKGEYALAFIKSLDKGYKFCFSDNLFLMCYYSFNFPLTAKDIMRMAKTFEFTNNNYIKKNPDIFYEYLKEAIVESNGTEKIYIKTYITDAELDKLLTVQTTIFANSSIMGNTVPIPLLVDNLNLKNAIHTFLKTAHEKTKVKVAGLKKPRTSAKTEPVPAAAEQPKSENPFPPVDPKYLNGPPEELNDKEQYYFYREQIEELYARIDRSPEYLELAIKACENQIAISEELAKTFMDRERFIRKSDDELRDDFNKLKKGIDVYAKYNGMELPEGFSPQIHKGPDCVEIVKYHGKGNLPEHVGFRRLCMIREKQKNYEEVIRLATLAKEEGWMGDWDKRIERAQKKLGRGK